MERGDALKDPPKDDRLWDVVPHRLFRKSGDLPVRGKGVHWKNARHYGTEPVSHRAVVKNILT